MRPSESPDAPIYVRNEDATKAANECCRDLVAWIDAFATAKSASEQALILARGKHEHDLVFDAFIYGVEYGRNNPRSADASAESADGGRGE